MDARLALLCLVATVLAVEALLPGPLLDLDFCPHLPCPFTGFCEKTVPTYFDYHGLNCTGCLQCVKITEEVRRTEFVSLPLRCPMVLCAQPPEDCGVPLVISSFTFEGQVCSGCPICPTVG